MLKGKRKYALFWFDSIQTYGVGPIGNSQSLSIKRIGCLYDHIGTINHSCSNKRSLRIRLLTWNFILVWTHYSFVFPLDFLHHYSDLKSLEMAHRLSFSFTSAWRKQGKSRKIVKVDSWPIRMNNVIRLWGRRRGRSRGRGWNWDWW